MTELDDSTWIVQLGGSGSKKSETDGIARRWGFGVNVDVDGEGCSREGRRRGSGHGRKGDHELLRHVDEIVIMIGRLRTGVG